MADESNSVSPPPSTTDRAGPPSDAQAMEEGKTVSASEVANTNGDAEGNSNEASGTGQDTEMKDADDAPESAAAGSSHASVPLNGTPASSKKTSNGSAKKKSSGVPEHKTKKLNKKKSKVQLTQLHAQPGDFYFARMKGHPPWPSVICDEEMLPVSLLESRPVTTKQADGTFKKPEYADDGKRAHERTFPVMFLATNEFAWMTNTDLTPLDPDTCKDPEAKGKTKILLAAYEEAAESHSLAYYKGVLNDHQAAIQADKDAEPAQDTKKSKSKRKSVDTSVLAGDADDMDIDEDTVADKPKSKKRKKETEADDTEEKPAKTPRTGPKLKLSTPKNPESAKKTPKSKASSSKKGKKAAAAASDDEATSTPKAEEPKLTPAEQKEKSQKLVLYYRHKLQRGFLSRDTTPKEEEMKDMSEFLGELEGYPDLDGSIIRATKIHKVLKAMLKLPSIPLDEEFKFKDRSQTLLGKWNAILASDPNGDKEDKAEASGSGAGVTNGEIAPEENEAQLKKKIGTTVDGADEAEEGAKEPAKVEKTAEEKKTDGPAVDSAPAAEYQPPAVEADDEASS